MPSSTANTVQVSQPSHSGWFQGRHRGEISPAEDACISWNCVAVETFIAIVLCFPFGTFFGVIGLVYLYLSDNGTIRPRLQGAHRCSLVGIAMGATANISILLLIIFSNSGK